MSGDKLFEPGCDGIHHLWSYSRPIVCKGCGIRFADPVALEREIELRKRGLVERPLTHKDRS